MTQKILEALIESNYNYRYYGLRSTNGKYEVGQELHSSVDSSDDGIENGEPELDGTCATGFGYLAFDEDDTEEIEKALEINSGYKQNHLYLIAGNDVEYGEDEQEIIISNAVIVAEIY